MVKNISLGLLAFLLEALSASCPGAARYQVAGLDTPPGMSSYAHAINRAGTAAGATDSCGALWRDAKRTDLGTLGQWTSTAACINDDGTVVGTVYNECADYTPQRAFVWRRGVMKDIGNLGDVCVPAFASAINNKGQVVGMSDDRGFLWESHKGMRNLGYLDRYYKSAAYGINNKGQVVGESGDRAFLWHNGAMTELVPLAGYRSSVAMAISDDGMIVGESGEGNMLFAGPCRACLWDKSGRATDLGTLGGDQSFAWAVNKNGQAAGWSDLAGGKGTHAFLWQKGKMVDLNDLIPADSGWVLQKACGINDAGQIVGHGSFKRQTRAFLLTPIR